MTTYIGTNNNNNIPHNITNLPIHNNNNNNNIPINSPSNYNLIHQPNNKQK